MLVDPKQLAGKLLYLTLKNGGCTLSPEGADLTLTKGFAVAFRGGLIFDRIPPRKKVEAFIRKKAFVLDSSPRAFVGTWMEKKTGKFYLDVGSVVCTRELALKVGKREDQKAIFDLEKMEEIFL